MAFFISTGVILGAAYMLWLYRRIIFGTLTNPKLKDIKDLFSREVLCFAPLLLLTLWMGIYPKPFLNMMSASVDNLLYVQMDLERPQAVEVKAVANEHHDEEVNAEHETETTTEAESH